MAEAKFTAGPWAAVASLRGFIITAKDGQYDIAVVRNIGNEDNEANARLIAASPDLLAALIAITDQLERVGDTREYKDGQYITTARAAIARAKGEA